MLQDKESDRSESHESITANEKNRPNELAYKQNIILFFKQRVKDSNSTMTKNFKIH